MITPCNVIRYCVCTARTADIWAMYCIWETVPDSKVHGANMGPIWGRQDPGGSRVGPMNLAIWGVIKFRVVSRRISFLWSVIWISIQTQPKHELYIDKTTFVSIRIRNIMLFRMAWAENDIYWQLMFTSQLHSRQRATDCHYQGKCNSVLKLTTANSWWKYVRPTGIEIRMGMAVV